MSGPINVRDLAPGTSVMLASGAEAEVVSNPGDGIWLWVCAVLSVATALVRGSQAFKEELV